MYRVQLRVFAAAKTSLLRRTSGIRAASEQTFRKPFEIDDADARSVQKTPAGVLFVRRGLFFVKRQRRCAVYFKRSRFS